MVSPRATGQSRDPAVAAASRMWRQSLYRLDASAARAVQRLVLRRWVALLAASAPWVVGVLAAAALAVRLAGGRAADVAIAAGLLVAWVAGCYLWAWRQRPDAADALAAWDAEAGRHQVLLSAYSFERIPESQRTAAQQLHLRRAAAVLDREAGLLDEQLPVTLPARVYLLPVALVALLMTPLGMLDADRPAPPGQQAMGAEALVRAGELREAMARQEERLESLEGLTPEEKQKLEALRKSLAEAARQVAEQGTTAAELLRQLEAQAAAAQELAGALGDEGEPAADSAMLEELARHTDTADFADAAMAGEAELASREAARLAERLERPERTLAETQRLSEAVSEAMAAADEADRRSRTGEELDKANEDFQRGEPREAAERFKALAEHFARRAAREASQRRLEELAEALRAGAQRVLSPRTGAMTQVAGLPESGLQPMAGTGGEPGESGEQGEGAMALSQWLGRGTEGGGLSRLAPNAEGRPGTGGGIPIPGQAGGAPGEGGQEGGGAPVPGGVPVPGASAGAGAAAGTGTGGLSAGVGTAELHGGATDPQTPGVTRTVAATTGDGPSQVRHVDAGPRREGGAVAAREVAIESLAAEEEALAAEPLPLSRREQVLRYFHAIRRQLEQQP